MQFGKVTWSIFRCLFACDSACVCSFFVCPYFSTNCLNCLNRSECSNCSNCLCSAFADTKSTFCWYFKQMIDNIEIDIIYQYPCHCNQSIHHNDILSLQTKNQAIE